jgi:DNA polymerase III epsilon subunit-like protein
VQILQERIIDISAHSCIRNLFMRFIKDILFFEIQTTGPDVDKDSVIQLSAILLDKDNLLEKANFNSHIRMSYLDSLLLQHASLLRIDYETMKRSPKVYDAVKQFKQKFDPGILLATHNLANVLFLKNAFKKAAVPYEYDHHILELWTLGYIYTLNYGLKKMPTFTTFLDYFKLKQLRPWDSMEKVRLEAEIFRKIIKEV